MDIEAQKRAAAARALDYVRPGMRLGLGSGSQVIIEKWNGGRFDKPATRVREMVLFLRQALTGERGDTVTAGGRTRHVVSYMKDFLFAPEQARSPLRVLSGGGATRVSH